MEIVEIIEKDRENIKRFLEERWFSSQICVRNEMIDASKLEGYIVYEQEEIIGLITYRIYKNICEIISLDSIKEKQGIGSELIKRVKEKAIKNNCEKLILITTNDNLQALGFYQKRGFRLSKIYKDSMDEVRKIKPEVPMIGENNIPLKDEIELEIILENNNKIVKIKNDKLNYLDLLLEADPEKEVVEKYIDKGDLYVYFENEKAVAEIFITKVDNDTCELKNIATLDEARGKGYASKLIQYVFQEYSNTYKRMIVGTTENMIPFYVLKGFNKYYKTSKNFFIENYNKEIFDGNLQCIDMYYYSKEFKSKNTELGG